MIEVDSIFQALNLHLMLTGRGKDASVTDMAPDELGEKIRTMSDDEIITVYPPEKKTEGESEEA